MPGNPSTNNLALKSTGNFTMKSAENLALKSTGNFTMKSAENLALKSTRNLALSSAENLALSSDDNLAMTLAGNPASNSALDDSPAAGFHVIKSAANTITGLVYADSNCNGIRDGNEIPLENVRIYLFHIEEINETVGAKQAKLSNNTVSLLQEKLIGHTFTDKNGEFSFPVKAGIYSVNLDVNTLPEGMGILNPDILIAVNHNNPIGLGSANKYNMKDSNTSGSIDNPGKKKTIEFGVRNVALIETKEDMPSRYYPGQEIILNAIPRDRCGKTLAAKINYSCENYNIELRNNIAKIKEMAPFHKEYTIRASCGGINRDIPITPGQFCGDRLCIIQQAYQNGIIDENTKINLYLKSFYGRECTSPEFWSELPVKCGERAIKEIRDYIARKSNPGNSLTEEAKRFFLSIIPPLDEIYISPSGFFKIHYTKEGGNAVPTERGSGIPEYIKQIGLAFDHVKNVTCDTRGFRKPIPEKGKKAMDIYVYDLQGIYGLTIPTVYYPQTSTKQRRASCKICIDNNYSSSKGFQNKRDKCMEVTAAHEFFHAVQYAYNVDADPWWKEASATWNEDEIYGDVNDYMKYLDKVLQTPEKPLDKSGYGGVIFAKFLSENYGGYRIIKNIWEMQGTAFDTSIKAINAVIKEKFAGEDLGIVYKEYAASNFNPSQYYKDGHLWNRPYIQNVFHSYPAVLQNGELDHLASSYHLFIPSDQDKDSSLKITVKCAPRVKWGFKIQQKQKSDGLCSTVEIPIKNAYNRAEIIIRGFGKLYKEVCLIPVNLESKIDGVGYQYSVNIL